MKKFLALGLSTLLVAGAAAPASAASQIDFSGYYRVYGMSETNLDHTAAPESFTDGYFGQRLNLDFIFKPTDELAVHWRLRGPSFRRWGSGNGLNQGLDASTYHLYGQIIQDWGTVALGRIDEDLDVYGLASLGYLPVTNPVFTTVGPFEEAALFDGIRYTHAWDNGFGLMVQYAKMSNNGEGNPGQGVPGGGPTTPGIAPNSNALASDQDYDRYQVEVTYKWDGGGVALNTLYDRDATPNALMFGHNRTEAWYLNPAIMHSWGDFSVHFEGKFGWGKERYTSTREIRLQDRDLEGAAVYLDFDYNYGPGNVTLAGWWAQGGDLGDDWDKTKSLVDMGGNFYPLLVAYNAGSSGWGRSNYSSDSDGTNAANVANASTYLLGPGAANPMFLNTGLDIAGGLSPSETDLFGWDSGFRMSSNEGSGANHWALALSGNHAFTDDITMHYALAYLALNKPNYRVVDSFDGLDPLTGLWGVATPMIGRREQSKDLGVELDLGLTVQLLDNLEFSTGFGYMWNGDAYQTLRGYNQVLSAIDPGVVAGQAVWEKPEDTYVWFNSLTFSF